MVSPLSDSEVWLLSLEGLDQYVVTVDRDLCILFINYSVVTDRKREHYVGTNLLDYIAEAQHDIVRSAIERAFETRERQTYDTFVRERWYTCRVSPIVREGAVIACVIRGQDSTEDKLARQRETEMEQRLLLSERMASMGSLASCIAHEINNPLTYVVGNLSYIADALSKLAELDASGKCRQIERAVADVREGVDRVRSVVSDLSMLSQPEQDTRGMLDVRRVLEASINVAKNEICHRARLEREYRETPAVFANEALLGQVFLNLMLGSARAMPEGAADRNVIRVSTGVLGDGRVAIRIADSGDPRSATGRGFSDFPFCRKIVAGFGGEIASEPGALNILLPAADAVVPQRVRSQDLEVIPAPAAPGPRARILVVDDEPVIAATMRRALEGHDVYIVTSGRDALELCRGESFDLVLCDLMMPDLTGMDLYDELKKDGKGREQRVIFMTGGAFTQRARKFLASVPNAWLKKPFDVEEIQTVVARAFE